MLDTRSISLGELWVTVWAGEDKATLDIQGVEFPIPFHVAKELVETFGLPSEIKAFG